MPSSIISTLASAVQDDMKLGCLSLILADLIVSKICYWSETRPRSDCPKARRN